MQYAYETEEIHLGQNLFQINMHSQSAVSMAAIQNAATLLGRKLNHFGFEVSL